MNRNYCFCTISYRCFNLTYVDIVGIPIDVYQNRPRARVGDRGNGGEKGMGDSYDLSSLPDTVSTKGHLERRGSRVESDRVFGFAEVCKLAFEHFHVPAKYEIGIGD